ncbi:hypothetical protein AbraIFM66950_003809 [Aspergillus brasiliensis]|nr:hypothetical protein AbraIFM66950_003809 [Aspergillus brasiliensis]
MTSLLPFLRQQSVRTQPHRLLWASTTTTHHFATKEASPGHSSNVANPQSSNPESQGINYSRGKEARHSDTADTRSVQSPISAQRGPTSEAHEGEEQTSADAQIKSDPNQPEEQKRRNVEDAGKRPLGAEDRQ